MNFPGGRGNSNIDKAGPPWHSVARAGAAIDSVMVPTEPEIVELAKRCLCIISLGVNCYNVTNVYGTQLTVKYGAMMPEWKSVCEELLEQAMNYEPI